MRDCMVETETGVETMLLAWIFIDEREAERKMNEWISGDEQNSFTGNDIFEKQLLPALKKAFYKAESIDLAVSFLMESGVRLVLPDLVAAAQRGVPIRILCGNYMNITQPSALFLLYGELKDKMDIRFYNQPDRSFHPKSYLFKMSDHTEVFIGSSNLSKSALTNGIEWNYRLTDTSDQQAVQDFQNTFEDLFNNHARKLDLQSIQQYAQTWKRPNVYKDIDAQDNQQKVEPENKVIVPRNAQIEALLALHQTREEGAEKALVQAATGTGKTYLAAFDSMGFKRVLFVAHREEILRQAAKSFSKVRPEQSIGFYTQKSKDTNRDIIFGSIQTLGKENHLKRFNPDSFDYIVIDEFHHAAAKMYQNLLNYFKPKFLLGLTATPERMDGRNIYEICDYNIPFTMDLNRAINQGILTPFRYYGIYDATDYSNVEFKNGKYSASALTQAYRQNRERYELIFKNYQKYQKGKALGFCSTVDHALNMTSDFRSRGIHTAAVISDSKANSSDLAMDRSKALEQLKSGDLDVIFCVDMFNEGVDIPALDMVMFLRPTESPVIFLQQLGRGLRKAEGKEYLTVLDFLGNYRNVNQIPRLLSSNPPEGKSSLNSAADAMKFPLPSDCQIDFDFRLLDLFKKMEESKSNARQYAQSVIDSEFDRIRNDLQHIPSRMDLFNYMTEEAYELAMNPKYNDISPFKNYLAFLKKKGEDSSQLNEILSSQAGEFLHLLETTSMSKVYKMPVLMSFIQDGEIKQEVTQSELLQAWKEFFRKNHNWIDLPKIESFQSYQRISDKAHLSNIMKNPVKFLIKSGEGHFSSTKEISLKLSDDLIPYLTNVFFVKEYKDIVRFRQMDYYRRRYKNANKKN